VDRHLGAAPRTLALGALSALAAAILAAACTSRPPPQGLGQRRAAAPARRLVVTADGAWLAFLDGCAEARAQGLPPGTASCDLRVVPAAGGATTRVAGAVSTLPGAIAVSPRGAELAALAGYDYAQSTGTLVRWRAAGGVKELAAGVTFHGYGLDGTLGYVAGGELFLAPPGGEPVKVAGVAGAATFELAAPGGALAALVRRRSAAGGELLAVPAARDGAYPPATVVGQKVGDYAFGRGRQYAFTRSAADGAELLVCDARPGARPEEIGRSVRAFAFSPDGEAIAWIGEAVPGKQGNLHLRTSGGEAQLAREVGLFQWARGAPRLAWLEDYSQVNSGTLGVGGPGLPRRTLAKNVSDLELSPDGKYVAYLQHTIRGGYSVDLIVAAVDAPAGDAGRRLGSATYGFGFSPDGRWLYYRVRCTRSGEACDLERVEPARPEGKPELVAEGVKSFDFTAADPGRLLLGWKRVDRDLLDLGVWEGGRLTRVDTHALPGSAVLVGPEARGVAYVVVDDKRGGVYLAELPPAGP
jgi:hypothetical protein